MSSGTTPPAPDEEGCDHWPSPCECAYCENRRAAEETHSEASPDVARLIEQIVDDLFVNGAGDRADRLVLTVDGPPSCDLGGWCRGALRDRLVAALQARETDRFVRYQVVRQAEREEGKPNRYSVYGFKADGLMVRIDEVYLRDHDEALAAAEAEQAILRQEIERLKAENQRNYAAWDAEMERARKACDELAKAPDGHLRYLAAIEMWERGKEEQRWLRDRLGYTDGMLNDGNKLAADLASLRQQHTQLREALAKYGRHEADCNVWRVRRAHRYDRKRQECNCGLSAALTSVPSVAPPQE